MTDLALAFRPLACASLAAFLGCGGVTSASNSVAPVAESDFAPTYKQAMCDLIRKCCSAGFDAAAACSAQSAPTASSPYQKYDPAQGGACIAAIRGSASTCTATRRDYDGCQKLYVGTQAIGASCQNAEDCAGAAYCVVGDSPPNSQVCYPTAKAGERCVGLYANPAIGGAALCGGGLYCDASSLCVPLAGLGQACDPLYLSSSCDPSLRCDPAGMKCTNKVPTGATCTDDSDCIDSSCSNGSCRGPSAIATSNLCSSGGESPVPTPALDGGM